jgi:leucine dehydrogenase
MRSSASEIGATVDELFVALQDVEARHAVFWTDKGSGLRAILVLDDVTLGPAAGGVRTVPYPSTRDALADAARLARAMTLKCSLAGLDAGGGKVVVIDHDRWDRAQAFEQLGRRVDELGGAIHAGSDLGTTHDDLAHMARWSHYTHTEDAAFADAVARGLLRCIEACATLRGKDGVEGLRVAVQGAGSIGAATARTLSGAGMKVLLADVNKDRAEQVAGEVGAEVTSPETILDADVDVVAPCALGGVLTRPKAESLRAWAVCGAANNVLAEPSVDDILTERKILHVPDVIASAGAVCEGIGDHVMGLAPDARAALIDRLGAVAREVLEESQRSGLVPTVVAERRARARIDDAKAKRQPASA